MQNETSVDQTLTNQNFNHIGILSLLVKSLTTYLGTMPQGWIRASPSNGDCLQVTNQSSLSAPKNIQKVIHLNKKCLTVLQLGYLEKVCMLCSYHFHVNNNVLFSFGLKISSMIAFSSFLSFLQQPLNTIVLISLGLEFS